MSRFLAIFSLCLFSLSIFSETTTTDPRIPMDKSKKGYPWSAIGKLKTDGGYECSAALVGEDLVITNAHCIYEIKRNGVIGDLRSGIEYYAAYRNGRGKRYRVKEVLMTSGNTFPRDTYKDWALLRLRSSAGKKYGYFTVADKTPEQSTVTVAAFSGDYREGKTAGIHENCSILAIYKNDCVLHNCRIYPGASGSPVLRKINDNEYQIVALNSAISIPSNRATSSQRRMDQRNPLHCNSQDAPARVRPFRVAVKTELFVEAVRSFRAAPQ